jgi:predicted amidohydrolase YtcJ
MEADLVLVNGRIYTFDSQQPLVSALAIRDGAVLYAGDDVTARQMLQPKGELVDLRGSCVVPGLADAHMHFSMYALGLQAVNAELPQLENVLAAVAAQAAQTPPGQWIVGFGWNHNVWGGEFPTAAQLDFAAPLHPVLLGAKSGHAVWVNSRALELAHITATTPDPAGGHIVRDADGQATGTLLETAEALAQDLIPSPTLDQVVAAMRLALPIVHRAGLTMVHDMDGPLSFSALQVLHQQGELTLRVNKSIPVEHLDEAIALGLRSGFGDEFLRVGQVKMFADGALGPRTAYMLQGYASAPAETGIAVVPSAFICEAVRKATAAGLSCAVHAIGDRACRETLDAYAQLPPQLRARCRNRIEHVQLLHPDDYARLAALQVIASMQPLHATSDMLMADKHWGQRCAGAYALRTQLAHGAVLALGSDCPVEVIDPLVGIHAAVSRRRADGTPGPEGWYPEQRLTAAEAVRGFTWGPAYAAGMERRLGTLRAGYLADLTILGADILVIPPMDILNAPVLGTMVGGRFVWRDAQLA